MLIKMKFPTKPLRKIANVGTLTALLATPGCIGLELVASVATDIVGHKKRMEAKELKCKEDYVISQQTDYTSQPAYTPKKQ